MDSLCDALLEAKRKYPGSWITIGGDWNGRNLDGIIDVLPELQVLKTDPTRNGAHLDKLLVSYEGFITDVAVNFPLQSETSTESDHMILSTESRLPRERSFTWEVHSYLKITKEGDLAFRERIKKEKWNAVRSQAPNNHLMAEAFNSTLKGHMEACYQ